ncbi:gluconokinase [Notoacmeibacter sp. MSK16QG-6]|uniref:gluconokinase n=1 Tax=Notoacmeibacter sp. MSK16QG-6 TaxID=2957982 RepID=UPI0020A147B7|nr:gluconokinase [Notoacmeibacter sp. MSK16QG-6]MCP1200255.1 gluconokinase [Notoacmeibacter sp. MSK16QG-6]
MGVCGTGKSSVGSLLAWRMEAGFVEADDYHSTEAVERMSRGVPLTDADRWDWIDRVARAAGRSANTVIACSALKQSYRNRLAGHLDNLLIAHLTGSRELIAQRMEERAGHFMPSSLLDSQFADLEPPTGDGVLTVDISRPIDEVAAAIHHFAIDTRQNA